MTATTMHFGPEWMRTKQAPSRTNPSPPLNTSASTGAHSYSALVTPVLQAPPDKRDLAHPFRYSKEDLIRIYKEGGGKGGLGLEVERWEGIVRELGADPVSLKEMGETEKKLFAGPLNSDMRRRPSTDYLSLSTPGLTERSKLNHTTAGPNSPLRERLGGYMGRRRDSTDQQPSLTLPRKLSQTSISAMPLSPREALPSPRTRLPGTAGIDGVLSDSWHVRKKTSEGILNSGVRAGEAAENQDAHHATGIKEEDDEKGGKVNGGATNGKHQSPQNDTPLQDNTTERREPQPNTDSVSAGIGKLSLNTQGTETSTNGTGLHTPVDSAPAGPPPGLVDLSTVEWSYLDPQGQVQGPFPAATMQKWYDDGYFTMNLLMKRTHIDTDWLTVAQLFARAGNPRIFLTPLVNPPPPGLPRRDPLLDGPAPDGTFGSPFQPVPARAPRTSVIDPYLHNGNGVPESPSSTFSGGRFSNNSPDPAVFAGRFGGHHFNDSPVGPRLASLVGAPLDSPRRPTFDEPVEPVLVSRPSFGNYGSGRTNSIDGLGYNVMDGAGAVEPAGPFSPGNIQSRDAVFGHKNSFHAARASQSSPMNNGQPASGLSDFVSTPGFREGPRLFSRDSFTDRPDAQHAFANGSAPYSPSGQSFNQAQLGFGSQVENRSLHSFVPDRQPVTPLAQQRSIQQPFISSPAASSPWPTQDPTTLRRPGPFDPEYPTARNTVVTQPVRTITPSHSFSQAHINPTITATNEQSPWFAASQGAVSDGWSSDSLTAANLGHHNRQQEEEARHQDPPVADSPAVEEPSAKPATPAKNATEPPVAPAAEPEAQSTKRRRKPTVQTPAAPSPQTAVPSKAAPAPAPAPALTTSKSASPTPPATEIAKQPAWGAVEEDKKKPSGATLGLREIQEMETKKLEARKVAERERERAARAAASSASTEEVQTLSWGLPTSQVGARSSPAVKEPTTPLASASPVVSSPPVWTTPAKVPVVKKTMKEIQEEEEKRKKMAAKEKETVAAAARRAYADTTTKAATPVQSGGAWSTVGVGGKTSAPVATPPARPAISTSASTKSVPVTPATPTVAAVSVASRAAASPALSRSPIITTSVKLAPASRAEEPPYAPSHDFLKWMTDSLKGLNNSVNLEEITSMLLTFPLDPDPSTAEIISDLIYANSTTLDGRRFAAEFVSKRKADAKGSAAVGRPLSIAEVVKTQPKPVQNEWGGFKVVNKKKKAGRS